MSVTTRLTTADELLTSPTRDERGIYTSPREVRILGEGDALDGGDVLPGFSYELSKLFAVKR